MLVEKKICISLDNEERDVINRFIKIKQHKNVIYRSRNATDVLI